MTAPRTAEYFAVPDPDTGDMTYWRRVGTGPLKPWPERPAPRYGPILWNRSGPGRVHIVPADLHGAARTEWIRAWWRDIRRGWQARIVAVVDADPVAAAARFADLTSHCFVCGRPLEDDDSKVYGIGPVCRPKLPPEIVAAAAREIGRAHGTRQRDDQGDGKPSGQRVLDTAAEVHQDAEPILSGPQEALW